KQPIVLLDRLDYIPEAMQEGKNHLGGGEAENTEERKKMAKKKKEKKSKGVDRASRKRKSGNNEKPAVKTEETTLEIDNQSNLTPPSHIPVKSLMDIEMELVYTDEEDIPFEFPAPMVSSSTESSGCDSGEAAAPSTSRGSSWTRVNERLQWILQEGSTCYQQNNYAGAVEKFSGALELCSKGIATAAFRSCSEDISSIASFIETKLVICYLKLRKPDDAVNHAHRSIILNPAYFRNHLRQAAVFRCLERYSEAARSTMIADYMYWLTGGTEQHTSKLIKQYWQAMIDEAITKEVSFSVMYTPFTADVKANKRNEIRDMFVKKHPNYSEHIYTDPHGFHTLPQAAEWPSLPPQQYLLTLGFRNKHIGKILERWSSKKLPIFSDRKSPFCPLTKEEAKRFWDNTGKKIVPVMDFIRSTKLIDNICPCSRGIEKLHYASLLGHLQRDEEKSQVINQAMAELATLPYLQEISQQDAKLLQSLMADAMDTLEGRSDEGRVWNKIQKIGLIEDYLYQVEDNYLKNKRQRIARTERMKRTRGTQQNNRPGNTNPPFTSPRDMATQQTRFTP
ncbi:SPT16 protein, partial [Trogon melanurus]|nr:SPT16 protein [Trogon melanurus]